MTDNKNKIQVIEILNPFEPNAARKHDTLDYRPGKTLADLYPGVVMRREFVFSLNGKIIEDEAKALTYPQAGDVIVMCPVISGGGGDGGGKSILRIVAIVALAFFTGGAGGFAAGLSGAAVGSVGYSLAYAGIMMAGSMVINALLPPPKTKATPGGPTAADTPTYGIDGPKNVSAEGIVVPVTYGTHRFGGNLINAYVINDNNSQLLHLLYNCGEGPIASISDILVNDTPIANYGDYQIETRLGFPDDAPIPWFAQQIVPRAVGQELTTAFITKVTETEVDQIRIDLTCPAGMYGAWETKPSNYALYSPVIAELRKVGTTAWLPFATEQLVISGNQKTALRRSFFSAPLPEAKYEIRVRRDRPAAGGEGTAPPGMVWVDNIYWTDYNEIQFEEVAYRHTALLGIRIRLTDQLNGLPAVTHVNGGRMIRCWNAATGQWVNQQASSNPAWIALDALTNKRYGGAQPISRFDLERWKEWAAHCDANGLKFNGIFDTQSNVWDATQPVFRAGHAGRTNVGTRFSVAIERPETPRMMFSVANMIQGTFKQSWLSSADRANELEITWVDKDDGYRQKIMRVVDTLAVNKGPKSSQVAFTGLTSADEVWRDANILLNQNRLLLQTVEFSAPLEAIACSVGDVVLVQHDMPKWSLAGRLEAGSTVGKVVLDRPVQMSPNDVYSVLVHMSAVKRHAGTISFIQGTGLFVSGYPGGMSVRRAKVAGKDLEVSSVIQQGNSHGVIVQSIDGIAAGMPIELWDTDAIETRLVVNLAAEADQSFTELTLATPLPDAPAAFTQWMFGKTNRTGKPFRIRSIRGTHDYQRDITALEYNADSYLTTAAPPAPNYSDLERYVKHAVIDGVSEEVFLIGPATRSRVTVHFSGQDETYFMSNVYLRRNEGDEEKVGENTSQVTVEAALGDELVFRVVARDVFMRSAPRSTAPTIYHRAAGRTLEPNDATGLDATMDSTGWQATWDPSPDADVTASELRIGASWETGRMLWRGNATSCRFAFQAAGEHQLRLRHCIGQTDGLYSGSDAIKTIVILPPTQPILNAVVEGRSVSLTWQDCVSTQPLFGYKVQKGPNAQELEDIGSSSTPNFLRIESSAGMHRYWVTALDVVGNPSAPGQIEVESMPSIDEAIGELQTGLDQTIAELAQTKQDVIKERQDRIADVLAEVNARVTAIQNEANTRSTAIQAETTARTTAINEQATKLNQEITDRAAAITAEQTTRAAALTAEANARNTAIQNEVTARNAAIAVETTNRTNAITAEANTRSANDAAEVTARTNAILQEAANRNAAIQNEATIRANDDAAEVINRQNLAAELRSADSTLTSAIEREATIRSTADDAQVKQRESLGMTLLGRPDIAADLSRVVGPALRLTLALATPAVMAWQPVTIENITSGWLYDEQQARITADSAEVTSRESLAAQLRGNYAGNDVNALTSGLVFNEKQARVAADNAEATARAALNTTVTNNKTTTDAAIVSEQTARSTGDAALGTRIDTLTATVNTDRTNASAAITAEQSARASGDAALGARVDTLTATVSGIETSGSAAISAEAEARAAADAAEARERRAMAVAITGVPDPSSTLEGVTGDSLDLSFGDADFEVWEKPAVDTLSSGLIYEERTARVAADAVEISQREALAATVNANQATSNAAITAEQTARATADSALGTRIDTLTSTVNTDRTNSSAAMTAEQTARATADTALGGRLDTLTVTVSDNKTAAEAAITAEAAARATTDTAEAAQREALSVALTGAPSPSSSLSSVTGPSMRLDLRTPKLGLWQAPALDTLASGLLFDEKQARITADTAEVSARQALEATVTNNQTAINAALTAEQTARANADTAEVNARESLAAQMRGTATGTDVAAVTSGLLFSEKSARTTADTAITNSVTALTATVTNNKTTTDAAITAEQTARATGDSANATEINSLRATVNNNQTTGNAAINAEADARATADAAEVAKRESLSVAVLGMPQVSNTLAEVEGPSLDLDFAGDDLEAWLTPALDILSSGLIFDERKSRITADEAEVTARQVLEAKVNTNRADAEAAIVAEQSARSTADSANADSIASLTATVNNVTNGLPSKATNTAVTALTTRVTNAEGLLSSQGDAITSLNSSLELGRADSQASLTADENMANAAAWRSHYGTNLAPNFVTVTDGQVATTVCRSPAGGGSFWNYSKSKVVIDPARTYRFTAWFRRVDANGPHYFNWWRNTLGTYGNSPIALGGLPNNTWVKLTVQMLGSALGDTSISPGFALNHTGGTAGFTEIQGYRFEDVTDALRITATETSKADATAVNALTTRVTNAEGLITSQGSAITGLTSSLSTTNGNVTAAQNAANAANTLAGGKGKVLVQSAAPAAADQLAQNLWIDTTNSANTPKRWNGSAWAAVTDKVATDAAAAAAAAQTTANSKADASAVNALTTRVTNAEGTITAQASSVTSLTATVNGHTSSISTNASAISALDGKVKSTWRLNVDANGKTAGMIIDNNGTVSTIAMQVDRFAIATAGPGGTIKYPFMVGNVAGVSTVGIDGNLVVDGTITTRTLAAESVTAEKIKAKSLTADQIAAGTITADLINVGVGSNLVPDSAFYAGDGGNRILAENYVPAGWGTWDNFSSSTSPTFGINSPSHDWHPVAANTVSIHQPNELFNTIQDKSKWTQVHSAKFVVTPGQRYEFSVYTAAHRCQVWCSLEFTNDAGSGLLTVDSTATNNAETGGGKSLAGYKRIGGFATAPATAATAVLIIKKGPTKAGSTEKNSWLFATQPMVAVASLSQTVFSPYAISGLGTAITPAGISTPSLSAITANVGLLRTQASGARTEIEANQIRVYDSNNVLRVRMGIW